MGLAGLAVLLAGLAPDPEPLLALLGRAGVDTGLLAAHWPRW
jgi:hypothetical protein